MLIRSCEEGRGMRRLPGGDRTFSLRFHFLRCGIIARVTNRNTRFRAGCSYNAIARSCFNNVGPANLSTGSHAHWHAHTHARATRNMLYRRFNKSCNDSYWLDIISSRDTHHISLSKTIASWSIFLAFLMCLRLPVLVIELRYYLIGTKFPWYSMILSGTDCVQIAYLERRYKVTS